MSITDWPAHERPREKLLNHGVAALSDAELLAIFLRTGVRGKTAVDLARELLTEFNGLRSLLEAEQQQFCKSHGLGPAKFAQLQAVLEMSRRHLQEELRRTDVMANAVTTRSFLTAKLRAYQQEVFACLFLDGRHRVIAFEELFFGSIGVAHVHPREVIKRALAHNAAGVIFAHNHPSGNAEPSEPDKMITQELQAALALIDVRVLDHIIIGDGHSASFLQLGLLERPSQ
jgi:DNA repair protein RadC